MADLMNILCALLTIAFGAFGFLFPAFTARALDLSPTGSTMGYSELRASVGGLFVVSGIALIVLNNPGAWVALGFCYAGAAAGRGVSLVLDHPPMRKVLTFGAIEAALAAWLIAANLPVLLG